jgi:hypothetical protein
MQTQVNGVMVRFLTKSSLLYGMCLFVVILFTINKYYHEDEFIPDGGFNQQVVPIFQEKIKREDKIIEPLQQTEEKKLLGNKQQPVLPSAPLRMLIKSVFR